MDADTYSDPYILREVIRYLRREADHDMAKALEMLNDINAFADRFVKSEVIPIRDSWAKMKPLVMVIADQFRRDVEAGKCPPWKKLQVRVVEDLGNGLETVELIEAE